MILNQKCENCKNARKAENQNYVGCVAALSAKNSNNESFLFDFYQRDQISIGWVNLTAAPDNSESLDMIPCFKKEDICKHYEPRDWRELDE